MVYSDKCCVLKNKSYNTEGGNATTAKIQAGRGKKRKKKQPVSGEINIDTLIDEMAMELIKLV